MREGAADVVQVTTVDLVDDLQVARDQYLEQLDRPALQRLGKQRVIGVGQCANGKSPGLIPRQARLIQQQAHQLGDRQRRMRVVHLDRDVVRQACPIQALAPEARDDVLQRAADQEVLLQESQRAAGQCRVIRIQHAGERFGRNALQHRAGEAALREFREVE